MNPEEILNLLLKTQYITPEDYNLALSSTDNNHSIALDYLVQNNIITYDIIGQAIAEDMGVLYLDLNTFIPSKEDVKKYLKQ